MNSRIMYIENKANGIRGLARIGRVTFSKSGKSLYYQRHLFQSLDGGGFKANYLNTNTGEEYWISGCKKDGGDTLYGGVIEVDDDVLEEYWNEIRNLPPSREQRVIRCPGKNIR